MGFKPVDQQPSFPALEDTVLTRWRERDVFARSLRAREGAPTFRVYEGPPTANGRPGVHHVPARTFKDVYPRYRTMKGYRVPRQGGWDCHGIPVEVQVERELGFKRKQDIEDFGVEAFNVKCRESVQRHVDDFKDLSERIGYWLDWDDAYWTMDASYVDSVWWSLSQLFQAGRVYEGHRVVPYCPRCGTALSDHEVAQGYATAEDPSVYVRFPLRGGTLGDEGAALLIWTTTPWTLISNTAVAVGRDVRYVLADAGAHGRVVLAADLVEQVLGEGTAVVRDVPLDELVGSHYAGPFDFVGPGSADDPDGDAESWRYVTVADFVTTTDGTGLVHLSPAFGADDMAVARTEGLPVVNPVDLEGRFDARVAPFAGQFVKDADTPITEDLATRGLLLAAGTYTHAYPFCWRCQTPLLYYAKPSWYIATTQIRADLLAENAKVDWHPEHIREGRYGDWLENNVDWALSRERYWGTPLPLWRCADCEEVTCVGSRAELGQLAGRDLSDLDPHRPYVDEVTFGCAACGGTARRVGEVIDAWYDSGAMPFAQFGYPWRPGSEELFAERFPANYICEGLDQTRGWFYSLMAISTLLFGRNSYETVLVLGTIVDDDGKKMSKSRGNVLDPWEVVATYGADALRWQLLTGSPWGEQRIGPEPLDEVIRKFLLTLWNTYYFFVTYARLDGWIPAIPAPPIAQRPVMDRWVLAELADAVSTVDAALEAYDATAAGRRIAAFTDDLSNWYVRRTRRRFWSPDAADAPDKAAAFATLYTCLVEVAGLLAPFTPFLADELHENLVCGADGAAPDSVHLRDFPEVDTRSVDDDLRTAMTAARQVTELGRRARNDARIGVRQPLQGALVTLPRAARAGWPQVADVVAAELNVRDLSVPDAVDGVVGYRLKPNFRALGPTFGPRTKQVAAAIERADAATVAAALADAGTASLAVEGEDVTVSAEQVQVLEEARTGWQVAAGGGYAVALDVKLDDDLRAEGLAREFVRAVNDLRKRRDLQLDDRIVLRVAAPGLVATALSAHRDTIAAEVLAVNLDLTADSADEELAIPGQVGVRVTLDVSG
ncbi:isoleucine--tRNA ligase [soil metagenome]